MLTVGSRVSLDITGLTHDAAGVGRHEGMAVFTPGALPGETVEAEITEVKPRFARAALLSVVVPAQDRVTPGCPVSADGRCGGCDLSHLGYEGQLRHKTQRVRQALARIGGLPNVPVLDCLPSPTPLSYRNKVQFAVTTAPVTADSPVEWRLGLLEPGTRVAHPAEECPTAHPAIREAARHVAAALNAVLPTMDSQASFLPVRHVVIRYAAATGELMVILVTPTSRFPDWAGFTSQLLARCPAVKSIVQLVNPRPAGTVLAGERARVAGRDYIEDELLGLRFHISPESFYQINLAQTATLYRRALEYAGLTGSETILDVYCGIGTITLLAARQSREAIGVESIAAAVEDAGRNAALNDLHNTRFLAGPAERLLPRLTREGARPDVVIVDPPRAGVEKPALDAIAAMRPSRLVYVSCDPESLARDLARLCASGYSVREVQPVDMFPQTSHTEAVAVLVRE